MRHFADENKGVRLDPTHLVRQFRTLHTHTHTYTHTRARVFRLNSAPQKELCAFMLIEKSNYYLRHVCLSVHVAQQGTQWKDFREILYRLDVTAMCLSTEFNSRIRVSNFCLFQQLSVCSELSVRHLTALKTASFLTCIKCCACFCFVLFCDATVKCSKVQWSDGWWEYCKRINK